jgi:accessory colonization factor AcfC
MIKEKVFISGSMSIKRLNENVIKRLENIVNQKMQVVIGDASGIDSSIQSFFWDRKFSPVEVYCSGFRPRNNIGEWPIKAIETSAKSGTREFYTAKDKAMANACNYGFMIWDTASSGTLSNAIELVKQKKNAVIYINKGDRFINIKSLEDFKELLGCMSESSLKKIEKKPNIKEFIDSLNSPQAKLI